MTTAPAVSQYENNPEFKPIEQNGKVIGYESVNYKNYVKKEVQGEDVTGRYSPKIIYLKDGKVSRIVENYTVRTYKSKNYEQTGVYPRKISYFDSGQLQKIEEYDDERRSKKRRSHYLKTTRYPDESAVYGKEPTTQEQRIARNNAQALAKAKAIEENEKNKLKAQAFNEAVKKRIDKEAENRIFSLGQMVGYKVSRTQAGAYSFTPQSRERQPSNQKTGNYTPPSSSPLTPQDQASYLSNVQNKPIDQTAPVKGDFNINVSIQPQPQRATISSDFKDPLAKPRLSTKEQVLRADLDNKGFISQMGEVGAEKTDKGNLKGNIIGASFLFTSTAVDTAKNVILFPLNLASKPLETLDAVIEAPRTVAESVKKDTLFKSKSTLGRSVEAIGVYTGFRIGGTAYKPVAKTYDYVKQKINTISFNRKVKIPKKDLDPNWELKKDVYVSKDTNQITYKNGKRIIDVEIERRTLPVIEKNTQAVLNQRQTQLYQNNYDVLGEYKDSALSTKKPTPGKQRTLPGTYEVGKVYLSEGKKTIKNGKTQYDTFEATKNTFIDAKPLRKELISPDLNTFTRRKINTPETQYTLVLDTATGSKVSTFSNSFLTKGEAEVLYSVDITRKPLSMFKSKRGAFGVTQFQKPNIFSNFDQGRSTLKKPQATEFNTDTRIIKTAKSNYLTPLVYLTGATIKPETPKTYTANYSPISNKDISSPDIILKESTNLNYSPEYSFKVNQNTAQQPATDTAQNIQSKSIVNTKTAQKQESISQTSPVFLTSPELITKQKTTNRTNLRNNINPNIPKNPPSIFTPKKSEDEEEDEELFTVQVKRKGKFEDIGQFSDIVTALKTGARNVKETASASFTIPEAQNLRSEAPKRLDFKKEFRFSKLNQNVIVERRSERINTPGELGEITAKGIFKKRSVF